MTTQHPTSLGDAVAAAMGDLLLELDGNGVCRREQGHRSLIGGGAAREIIGVALTRLLPNNAQLAAGICRQVLDDGVPRSFDCHVEADGRPRYLEARVATGLDGNLLLALRDNETRALADARLRESEERFRVMADCAPVMLWRADKSAECDFFNSGWREFTGRPLEAELGVGWTENVHPEDFEPCINTYLDAFVARVGFRMEYRLRRRDGEYRWILDHGVPRFAGDGTFEGFIGSCIDITEMKQATQTSAQLNVALEQRVRERDVLLREIHHRVKNNLQLISSILSLQARLMDGQARAVLEEGQLRVRSIALVHEKLCESSNVNDIELGQYIHDLIRFLRRAVSASPNIEVRLDAAPMPVAIDQAIPCGLLINELVTNAFKHAFPETRRGLITVQVRPLEDDRFFLRVSDDGIGLPDHIDLVSPRTLGLDLVATLARQLDAELKVERNLGTSFAFELTRWRTSHADQ
jgi:PAS domain S-box-containing protein